MSDGHKGEEDPNYTTRFKVPSVAAQHDMDVSKKAQNHYTLKEGAIIDTIIRT